MGLGVFYKAPLPRRGLLKKPISVASLWRQISALGLETVEQMGKPLTDWYASRDSGERLWIGIVPFEEDLEFSIRDGHVYVSAKTSGAGPGYHELVVALLDTLEKKAELVWAPHGKDEGDDTGYRTRRDSAALRNAMAQQLATVASSVVKQAAEGALLNMSTDDVPSVRSFAASPLGEWSREWMERAAQAKGTALLEMAEEFFPWWESGLTPANLAKFGKVVCWTAVRWVKPRTAAEEHAVRIALECFDQAQRGGARVPEREAAELARLLAPDGKTDVPPAPEGMGFRRHDFSVSLPGRWALQVPGYFHEEIEDEGTSQVYWFGNRTIRASTLRFNSAERSREDVLRTLLEGQGKRVENLSDGVIGAANTIWSDADECFVTLVCLVGDGSVCSLSFAHPEERDRDWALKVAATAKHRAPEPA